MLQRIANNNMLLGTAALLMALGCDQKKAVHLDIKCPPQDYENLSPEQPGDIISAIRLDTKLKNDNLNPEADATGIFVYKVLYKTSYKSRVVDASGILIFPDTCERSFPMISLGHATETDNQKTPSQLPREGLATAASGFAVAATDYIGHGEWTTENHPYLIAETYAQSGLDFLRAIRAYGDFIQTDFMEKLFLKGYDEGGYATLALQRKIEASHLAEFNLVASAPGSGGFIPSSLIENLLKEERKGINPILLKTLLAYSDYYGQDQKVFLNPKQGVEVDSYFEGSYSLQQIEEDLLETNNLIKPEFKNKFIAIKSELQKRQAIAQSLKQLEGILNEIVMVGELLFLPLLDDNLVLFCDLNTLLDQIENQDPKIFAKLCKEPNAYPTAAHRNQLTDILEKALLQGGTDFTKAYNETMIAATQRRIQIIMESIVANSAQYKSDQATQERYGEIIDLFGEAMAKIRFKDEDKLAIAFFQEALEAILASGSMTAYNTLKSRGVLEYISGTPSKANREALNQALTDAINDKIGFKKALHNLINVHYQDRLAFYSSLAVDAASLKTHQDNLNTLMKEYANVFQKAISIDDNLQKGIEAIGQHEVSPKNVMSDFNQATDSMRSDWVGKLQGGLENTATKMRDLESEEEGEKGDVFKFVEKMVENDLQVGWTPVTPTKVYHCQDDEEIPVTMTEKTVELLKGTGKTNTIEKVIIASKPNEAPYTHGTCPALFGEAIPWFKSLLLPATKEL
tara:strand:- start:29 stop:2257 length:2229 start_codon:yes stop_codon:yes gene_type:complete